jgi:hypothetical protein
VLIEDRMSVFGAVLEFVIALVIVIWRFGWRFLDFALDALDAAFCRFLRVRIRGELAELELRAQAEVDFVLEIGDALLIAAIL